MKNKYPLPWIDELIDNVKGDNFFTEHALKLGYHQILIETFDVWKLTFKTKEGLLVRLVIPFVLTNAPIAFMRYMDDLQQTFIGKCVIFYLNDILIFR